MPHEWKQPTSLLVILALLCLTLRTSPAVAGWAPTRSTLEGPQARLVTLLEREEIARTMEGLGVDAQEAVRRASGLTDAEAELVLERLESVPAGGDSAFGVIIGAVLVVFLVLLITDLLGLTHFYPFTKGR
jgi:hypothetical protein